MKELWARFFRNDVSALVGILIVAAILRLIWLDRLPVGWHYDEAVQGIWGREILAGIQRPIFFPAFTGQEPLYFYLIALVMGIIGDQGALTVRLTSALLGIGTVAGTYFVTRELFGRRVALVTTLLVAISLWHLVGSRNGYRTISQPFFETWAFYFILSAIRTGSTRRYIIAGLALASVAYTYLASRAVPILLAVYALWWLARRGWPEPKTLRGLALGLVVAFLVFALLGWYFLTHPSDFFGRMGSISVFSPTENQGQFWEILLNGIVKTLGVFTWYGDPLWRFNLTERPIFVGIMVPLFYLGLLLLLRRSRCGDARSTFVVLWIAVMLLPMVLSAESPPYTQRGVGIIPAIFALPALGIVALWEWLDARIRARLPSHAALVLLPIALVFVVEGATTVHDYFGVYAESFPGALNRDADLQAMAQFLRTLPNDGSVEIFASTTDYHDPTTAHLAPEVYPRLRWSDSRYSLVFSPTTKVDTIYVFPWSAMPPERERFLPPETTYSRATFENGVEKYVAHRLTPEQVKQQLQKVLDDPQNIPLNAQIGDLVELVAYRADRSGKAGETVNVSFIWKALKGPVQRDFTFFVHLLDHTGMLVAQRDGLGYPPQEWRPGEYVVNFNAITVPDSIEPGRYVVRIGMFDKNDLSRLPVLAQERESDRIGLGDVKLSAKQVPEPASFTHQLDASLGQVITLKAFDFEMTKNAGEGHTLDVRLLWEAKTKPPQDYTVFVQLVDQSGRLVAQSDSMPAQGGFPTSLWDPGERVVDRHQLALPQSLPPGRYTLIAGMYLLATGQRLPVESGGDFIPLGSIELP